MAQILDVLERTPLFAGVEPLRLASLLLDCRMRTHRGGDRIVTAGDRADAFHVVATGSVQQAPGPENLWSARDVLRPGEVFGLLAVMKAGLHLQDATALGECSVVRVPAVTWRRLEEVCPRAHTNAVAEVSARKSHRRQGSEGRTGRVAERVAQHVLALAESAGAVPAAGVVVDLAATRARVAASLGTVREVFTRSLLSLQRDGIVAVRGRTVEILDPARLREMGAVQETGSRRRNKVPPAGGHS
jgi:CRP-like cAMP-binding protein